MFQWLRSKTPPKVERIGIIKILDRDLSEGKFRSILLRWMPHITKEELKDIVEICRHTGGVHLRFTKKAERGLNKTKNIVVHSDPIIPVQDARCRCEDRHGQYVCGDSCARGLEENAAWSGTNIGLNADDEGCKVRLGATVGCDNEEIFS